jgi:hypothetical protein
MEEPAQGISSLPEAELQGVVGEARRAQARFPDKITLVTGPAPLTLLASRIAAHC